MTAEFRLNQEQQDAVLALIRLNNRIIFNDEEFFSVYTSHDTQLRLTEDRGVLVTKLKELQQRLGLKTEDVMKGELWNII